jgi:hypothetical protein
MKHAKMPLHYEHYTSPMVHPVTEKTITTDKKLVNNPATAEVWQMAFGRDLGGMAQRDKKTGQRGTNAMSMMTHNNIAHALVENTFFTYGNPVINNRPQKGFSHWIQITEGGNWINYESSAFVQTVDLDTAKLHWKSIISTALAKYMCLDIKNFYLMAALEYFECMKILLTLFPAQIVEQHNQNKHALNGYVHLEIRRAVWWLPQMGILANKCLQCKLAPFGYYKSTNISGLWCHETRPIMFNLVIEDFGVKYVNKDNVSHFISSMKKFNSLTKDWTGNLYCGIWLDWDYKNHTVDISMPGYIKKKLQEYGHIIPNRAQMHPCSPEPKQFGTEAQAPLPPDASPKLDA